MKNLFFLFLLVFTISCTSDQNSTPEVAMAGINVAIENTTDSLLVVSTSGFKSEIVLENGIAKGEIDIPQNGLYYLRNGKKYVTAYLEQGKNVDFSYNLEDIEGSFASKGDLAVENQYLQDKAASDKEAKVDSKTKYTSSEEDYLELAEADKERQNELLQSIQTEENQISPSFLNIEKNNVLYNWANQLSNYQDAHRYYSKNEEFVASDKMKAYKPLININDAEALSSSQFQQFVGSHLYEKANTAVEENEELEGTDAFVHQFGMIPDVITDEKVKNHFYFKVLSDILDFAGVDKATALMDEFNAKCTDETKKTKFKEKYEEWSNLVKGKPAPGFEYPDIAGTLVSLEELKGKNVYIDIWATWCGPCLREQPYLEELQTEYKDNSNILFASVSIDDDKEAWEKMVTEKELKGVHLIADNAWSSDIIKDYLIRGIPRFLLIDAEGNIINVNAPRPSSDELKEVLAGLADKT